MDFFDCNAFIGLPARRGVYTPAPGSESILKEMDFCGVQKALVWHIAQQDASPHLGNDLVAKAIESTSRLIGCWSVLPNQAKEFPPLETYLTSMKAAKVYALRAFPLDHHFLLNGVAMGSWLESMTMHRVPLLLSVARGSNWDILYSVLAEFPNLVVIICDHGCWGEDRRFRPLIERYPNVYIDTAQYLLDGGIESFVEDYGYGRMLFGSGFPASYLGGMMLTIRHAEISEEAKTAIAGENLERLLSEVTW